MPGGAHGTSGGTVRPRGSLASLTYLFRSQMISGLGLPSALHVKNTVFPEVTSASWGSEVIRGLSVPRRKESLGLKHPVKVNKSTNQIPHVPEKIPSEPSIPATSAPTRRMDASLQTWADALASTCRPSDAPRGACVPGALRGQVFSEIENAFKLQQP